MGALLHLKGIVLAGLRQAQKLIALGGDERIDLQFRIMTPEGDFWIPVALAADPDEAATQWKQISKFMVWKKASVFTLACELADPGAVYCFGAMHSGKAAALSAADRDPLHFGAPEWLDPEEVSEEIFALLPPPGAVLDAADIVELDAYFGANGLCPAMPLGQSAS
jgi:hypothetical protein